MRVKNITGGVNAGIVKAGEIPFADEFRLLAKDISTALRASLDSGDITDIEAAGRQALAAMLTLYANGNLQERQMLSFLKSLAERKTPDPVLKAEVHNTTDMRVLVQELIQSNPGALDDAIKRADDAKLQIQSQLKLPATSFELAPASSHATPLPDDATPSAEPGERSSSVAGNVPFPEPGEVQNIRAGRSPQEGIDGFKRFSQT